MKIKENTFYYCYVEGTSGPRQKHKDYYEAVKEAKRLSRNNLGKEVFVLQPMKSFVCQSNIETTYI